MADFLLELFSEEIPARMQHAAAQHLEDALLKTLSDAAVSFDEEAVRVFVTPRRLAVFISNLPLQQADSKSERKGPKADAPEAAVQGFLKSTGLTLAQLENRGGTYFATLEQKGQPVATLLKTVIETILADFPWPKSMRWGNGKSRWVRPLQNICCLFDGQVVPVEFAGLLANTFTFGHRFLKPERIEITDAAQYEAQLSAAKVIANAGVRKASILAQAEKLAGTHGLRLKEDAALLEEVTGLVEWPVVLMGRIDEAYMHLPPEVLISVMRGHQKYFALLNHDGSLSPYFLITANIETPDGGKAIIAGNERVLRARLADGRFFWEQDQKIRLEDWAKGLESVTYHAKLGSVAEKVTRVEALAQAIAHFVPDADATQVARAAHLSKADLVTGMVGEFPELQGIMGRYYALAQGEDTAVADAIRDHYKPLGANDSVPITPLSVCLALADKLDTLISMFAIGEKPTGSKDPFALRRAALGVIRIILENKLRVPLSKFMPQDTLDFFHDRLKVMLKEQGIRHDRIQAVLYGDDDMLRIAQKAAALAEMLANEDGVNLLAAYKRAANILNIEEKKDKIRYDAKGLNQATLQEYGETTLVNALEVNADSLQASLAHEDFTLAMQHLANLRAPLDMFFDQVLVNAPDVELRRSRLCLLAYIKATMEQVADFSKIEG